MPDTRLDLDQALAALLADTRPLTTTETVSVTGARGRILASDVRAPINLPPFRASAMDGYAVHSRDCQGDAPVRLRLGGTSLAGHPLQSPTPPGHCARIFTGAAVPDDLDAVVIQENCEPQGDEVIVHGAATPGSNVRDVGHDVPEGTRILEAGGRLGPFDVGWLAACGIDRITVAAAPRVGVFSTGDELLEPGTRPGPGQIFDANRVALAALLGNLPVTIADYGIVADDPRAIRQLLERADDECDLVVTSGGVSVGDADWVKRVVEDIGTLGFWRLNLKPGKPVAYGRLSRAAFLGLPGNPVSTIVTALLLVRPVLQRLCGGIPTPPLEIAARLEHPLRHEPGREEFQRGTLRLRDGENWVATTGDQSSNRLGSFAGATCLVRIPKASGNLEAGSPISVLPFEGLL